MRTDNQSKTLCLVMIVKNEAKNLDRCLSAVKDHIDYYVIVDTGSTDNTIEVINNQFNSIAGEIIERPWINFGHNRSESLQLAKDKADYMILCDADEELMFDEFNINELVENKDAYHLNYNGNLDYSVPYLLKGNRDWFYEGVTHEFLSCKAAFTTGFINSISITDHHDGGAKSDKFTRDIKLLTQGLIDEPKNVRYMFYLANSYRNVKDYDNAILWYKARIDSGGWIEEITCAYEYLGECYNSIGKKSKALDTWIAGYEYNPSRAECIYEAIKLLRLDNKHRTAWALLEQASNIPYPEDDILFIRRDVYDYLLDLEKTYLAYYYDKNYDVRDLFKKLLADQRTNHQLLLANYKFYSKEISEFEIDCVDLESILPNVEGYNFSSPCIIPYGSGYLVNVRLVSYNLIKDTYQYSEIMPSKTNGKINTRNMYAYLDNSFHVIDHGIFELDDFNSVAINGLEDVRILRYKDKIMFSATKWISYQKICIATGEYDTTKDKLEYSIIQSPMNRNVEKNWAMYIHKGEMKFLYDWNPILSGKVTSNQLSIIPNHTISNLPTFRGSSPGYEYKDEIYFLAHSVEYSEPRHYYHSIVVFDKNTFEYKCHSNLFTFNREKIEFGLGLIIEDKKIIISHSTWDGTSKIKIYDKKRLFADVFH
jgi:hypothetical protein